MNFNYLVTKVVSIGLIISSLYQVAISTNLLLFIYPNLDLHGQDQLLIQEGLIEKAIIIYLGMIVSGFYGVGLLFKPSQSVKLIHVLGGIIIFFLSLFFMVKTPFTTDPFQEFLLNLFGQAPPPLGG